MIHEAQHLKRTVKICFMTFQKLQINVLPRMHKIRHFNGFREVGKKQAGLCRIWIVAPVAVCKLVSNTQAICDSRIGIGVSRAQTNRIINRSHEGIRGRQANARGSNSIESGEHRMAKIGRFHGIKTGLDLQFTEGGE